MTLWDGCIRIFSVRPRCSWTSDVKMSRGVILETLASAYEIVPGPKQLTELCRGQTDTYNIIVYAHAISGKTCRTEKSRLSSCCQCLSFERKNGIITIRRQSWNDVPL